MPTLSQYLEGVGSSGQPPPPPNPLNSPFASPTDILESLRRNPWLINLYSTGSEQLPGRAIPWNLSLNNTYREFADKFLPGEGKEGTREDLLERANVPGDLMSRILASAAYARNESKAPPGWRPMTLPPMLEQVFQDWVRKGNINFDPSNPFPDYDMRAWWEALRNQNPKASYNLSEQFTPLFPPAFTTPYSLDFGPQSDYWRGR